jgi:hypothetical protein
MHQLGLLLRPQVYLAHVEVYFTSPLTFGSTQAPPIGTPTSSVAESLHRPDNSHTEEGVKMNHDAAKN